jgi:hypothetical protein
MDFALALFDQGIDRGVFRRDARDNVGQFFAITNRRSGGKVFVIIAMMACPLKMG